MNSTRLARLFAAMVDLLLAALIAAGAALRASGTGIDAALEATPRFPWSAIAGIALLLFALRDVPSGASLAKWLLGLRLATPTGERPSLGSRLARAPLSVLPFAWWSERIEAATPWRVVAYSPSAAGLVARLALATAAVVAAGAAAFTTLRPGIGRDDALQLARATVAADPLLQRDLGAPISIELGEVAPRRTVRDGALFAIAAEGPRGRQSMSVVARRVGERWAIEEIFDIETVITGRGNANDDTLGRRR